VPTTPAKPATLLLVRHGLTATTGKVLPGRAAGLHLSDKGREQAEAAAARIASLDKVAAIYASPLERAQETAEPIARVRKLKIRTEPGLLECDFGEWTGKRLSALSKKPEWKVVQGRPSSFRFPEGESIREMQGRLTETLDRLAKRHAGGTIVCVSHADPIKSVVVEAMGAHLDSYQRVVISPCSITVLVWHPMRPTVMSVNSTDHLGTALPVAS
jgi:probable phosphomutase (TIGR03848 family)